MNRSIIATTLSIIALAACGGEKPAADPSSASSKEGAEPVKGDWSLSDKETWTAYQADAKEWSESTSKKCGPISGSWNAESFKSHMSEVTKDPHTRGRCQGAFDAAAEICGQGDMQKQALMKKVKSVECVWGEKGKGGASIQGSKLVVTIETNSDAWTPDYKELIRKQL